MNQQEAQNKDYLVRATLPKIDNGEGFGPCGMDACQVCDYIIKADTFTTRACGVVFKVKKGPLNCNSEKVFPV